MKTFKELKDNIAVLVQRSGDSDYVAKIGVWVNLSLEFLYNSYDYYPELEGIYNFTSVASQESYGMPNDFDKPFRVYDITNDREIDIDDEFTYFDANIANIADATEGEVSKIRFYGVRGSREPIGSSGITVQAKSSQSESSANATIRIEGYVDAAKTILDYEELTVTGTSFTAATSNTFYEITHISKDIDTNGYITIADSSSNTIATMASWERVLVHRIAKLGLIPDDAATNFRVLYKRKYRKLVNDNDYPFVDADDFIILNAWGYALAQEKETVDRAQVTWNKASESLAKIFQNKVGSLGPSFQHKVVSQFLISHTQK